MSMRTFALAWAAVMAGVFAFAWSATRAPADGGYNFPVLPTPAQRVQTINHGAAGSQTITADVTKGWVVSLLATNALTSNQTVTVALPALATNAACDLRVVSLASESVAHLSNAVPVLASYEEAILTVTPTLTFSPGSATDWGNGWNWHLVHDAPSGPWEFKLLGYVYAASASTTSTNPVGYYTNTSTLAVSDVVPSTLATNLVDAYPVTANDGSPAPSDGAYLTNNAGAFVLGDWTLSYGGTAERPWVLAWGSSTYTGGTYEGTAEGTYAGETDATGSPSVGAPAQVEVVSGSPAHVNITTGLFSFVEAQQLDEEASGSYTSVTVGSYGLQAIRADATGTNWAFTSGVTGTNVLFRHEGDTPEGVYVPGPRSGLWVNFQTATNCTRLVFAGSIETNAADTFGPANLRGAASWMFRWQTNAWLFIRDRIWSR